MKFSRGQSVFSAKNWKERVIHLKGSKEIVYFDKDIPKGVFGIKSPTMRKLTQAEADGYQFAFEITTSEGSLVCASRTASDRDSWMEMIEIVGNRN